MANHDAKVEEDLPKARLHPAEYGLAAHRCRSPPHRRMTSTATAVTLATGMAALTVRAVLRVGPHPVSGYREPAVAPGCKVPVGPALIGGVPRRQSQLTNVAAGRLKWLLPPDRTRAVPRAVASWKIR